MSLPIGEDIDFQSASRLLNLLDPVADQESATKAYVDNHPGLEGPAGENGVASLPYNFNTATTSSDPGSGLLKFNSSVYSSATRLYISKFLPTSASNITAYLGQWTSSLSAVKGKLIVYQKTDITALHIFSLLSEPAGPFDDYHEFEISHVAGDGTFSNNDPLSIQFIPNGDVGDVGDAGADGIDFGLPYIFDSSTDTSADPADGRFRFNAGQTHLLIRGTDAESRNVSGMLGVLLGASGSAVKALARIEKVGDPTIFRAFLITSAVIPEGLSSFLCTGAVQSTSGSLSANDEVNISIYRVGDKGDIGDTGPAGADASLETVVCPASESILTGRFVNLWSDGGTLKARVASTAGKPAHGYVRADVTSPNNATVYLLSAGSNEYLSGLAVGTKYFLGTSGGVTSTVSDLLDGDVLQELGVAVSATKLVLSGSDAYTLDI